MPAPLLNDPIRLDKEAQKICGKTHCYGDAVWKEQGRVPFDMEYQSLKHHAWDAKLGEDCARQLAIQRMGYDVQFVTKAQLNDVVQLNELARLVSIHTGHKLSKSAFEWSERRLEQHEALMRDF